MLMIEKNVSIPFLSGNQKLLMICLKCLLNSLLDVPEKPTKKNKRKSDVKLPILKCLILI
jgi:hypothetical protein